MKTSKEIIESLIKGVEVDKIDWEVNVSSNIVKATHDCPLTKNRTISYKIFYNHQIPDNSRLNIIMVTKTERMVTTTPVVSITKEKDGIIIIKEVNLLLEKIINFHDLYRKNQNTDQLKVGDRVIVIKEQNFGGQELGKKGTLISEVDIGKKDMKYFTVCFDIRFSNNLTYSETAKKNNCWIFNASRLQKINLESTWTL